MALIDYWHTENLAWGSRKIRALLRNDGYFVSRKTIQKYMREMAIYPIYPKVNTSKRNYCSHGCYIEHRFGRRTPRTQAE